MRKSRWFAGWSALVLVLAACGGSSSGGTPVTPQSVSTNAVAISTPVVKQLVNSLGTIGGNAQLQALLARLGLGTSTTYQLQSAVAVKRDALSRSAAPRRGAIAAAASWVRQHVDQPTAGDASAQAFADFLQNRVFTQANLESSDSRSATFLLHGVVVCADPAGDPAAVQACAQQLDAMKLRVRAVPHGETAIDLELMFGDARAKPVTLALTSTPSIAVTVDLAAAKSTVAFLGAALGTPVDTLPSVMTGIVTVAMKVENQTKLTIDGSISQAIDIQVDGTTPAISIHVGSVASLFELVADGSANTVALSGALTSVALTVPEQDALDPAITHRVDATVSGASGSLLLRGNDETAAVTFDLEGLEAKRDGVVVASASLANACTAELSGAGIAFTSPLDATLANEEDTGLVTRRVVITGTIVPHDAFYDSTSGTTADYLELLAGATVDVTGGTTIHAVGPTCVNVDAETVGACPAF